MKKMLAKKDSQVEQQEQEIKSLKGRVADLQREMEEREQKHIKGRGLGDIHKEIKEFLDDRELKDAKMDGQLGQGNRLDGVLYDASEASGRSKAFHDLHDLLSATEYSRANEPLADFIKYFKFIRDLHKKDGLAVRPAFVDKDLLEDGLSETFGLKIEERLTERVRAV